MESSQGQNLYYSSNYFNPKRFASYSYQLSALTSLNPTSILEIGVGNGIVSYLLRNAGFNVTTLDFDKSLHPDIVASIVNIPLESNTFDAIACFQVLEHLPFELLPTGLKEIHRVSKNYAVISLPDVTKYFKAEVFAPKFGNHRSFFPIPNIFPREHKFDGEHHWEIGKKGYSLEKIIRVFTTSGFELKTTYRPYENPYHRFFICQKKIEKML
ncbi:MAG: hypothetical protein BWK78_01485 [Thiotrichaceae bacterium IS1]|nr:MAG: hypothetical protein BWK78_01485 [Thiotrichaceae bacterium IS1]